MTADRQSQSVGRRKSADVVQNSEKHYTKMASQFALAQLMVSLTGV